MYDKVNYMVTLRLEKSSPSYTQFKSIAKILENGFRLEKSQDSSSGDIISIEYSAMTQAFNKKSFIDLGARIQEKFPELEISHDKWEEDENGIQFESLVLS